MIDFQKLDGPEGIPVYFQKLPVSSVSIQWLVFVGSADDETVGDHGIYHWFEHIPSRGTEKYPGGYRDTEARLVRHSGAASAETGYTYTSYDAQVPRRVWTQAFDILTDMIAAPLLRSEDIAAEREIIRQEIAEWHCSPYDESVCRLPAILWPNHPLGHDQLGTNRSLDAISPEMLRQAHQQGYTRSRCVLLAAGDITESELLDEAARCAERLNDGRLPRRSQTAEYGSLPKWKAGQQTIVPTGHDDTVTYFLFPAAPLRESTDRFMHLIMLEELITAGDLGSPLNQIVRERSQLAYSPEFTCSLHPDGGYWGFVAQTDRQRSSQVVETFWEVLQSEELRSEQWYDYVRDTIRGEIDMHDPSPGDYTEIASGRLLLHGVSWSDAEYRSRLLAISREEMNSFLDSITLDQAHTIVFEGRQK